jgi:hypothetical protein
VAIGVVQSDLRSLKPWFGVALMARLLLALSMAAVTTCLLAGCGVVSGAASVAGTAVSVTGSAVGTAADIVTAPIR